MFQCGSSKAMFEEFHHGFTLCYLQRPLEVEEELAICTALRAKSAVTTTQSNLLLGILVRFDSEDAAKRAVALVQRGNNNKALKLEMFLNSIQIKQSTLDSPIHVQFHEKWKINLVCDQVSIVAVFITKEKLCVVDSLHGEFEFAVGNCTSQQFVNLLVKLDPDCIITLDVVTMHTMHENFDLTKLSRVANQPASIYTQVLRIPGRFAVDLVNFARLIGINTPALSAVTSAWECYHLFHKMGGLFVLNEVLQGYRFADCVEFGFPSQAAATKEVASSKKFKRAEPPVAPMPYVRNKSKLAILAQSIFCDALPQLATTISPQELSALAVECAALGRTCLNRLNHLVVDLRMFAAVSEDCKLLRPAYLKLQVLHMNASTSTTMLKLISSTTAKPSFFQTITQSAFVEWLTSSGEEDSHAEFHQVLAQLPDGDLKRLVQMVQSGPIRLTALKRFQEDWLDNAQFCSVLAASFESVVASKDMPDVALQVFTALKMRVVDVFDATCPKRLKARVLRWRQAGERLVRKTPVVPTYVLNDGGFSLWSKALGGSRLGMNTLCFAIGFLLPRQQQQHDVDNATDPFNDEFVSAAFLTSLVTCISDEEEEQDNVVAFLHDIPTFAYLVQHTYTSAIRQMLRAETLARLDDLVKYCPNAGGGSNLALAIAMFLFHPRLRHSSAATRQQLYLISNNMANVGCALAMEIQKSGDNEFNLLALPPTKEEERLVLLHLQHTEPCCVRCGSPLDLLWKVHVVCAQSPAPLVLLSQKLEKMAPIPLVRLQLLGKQVCKSMLMPPTTVAAVGGNELLLNTKIRTLGAIAFREGGKQVILEQLDWPGFIRSFLGHAVQTLQCNSFVLLHELCTRLSPPPAAAPQQQQQMNSCFVNKREDAVLFQIERTHHLCFQVLQHLVKQPTMSGLVWVNGLPTSTALMELYLHNKNGGGGNNEEELAQAMIQVLLYVAQHCRHPDAQALVRDFAHLVHTAVQMTPLLHALRQLLAPQKSQILSLLGAFDQTTHERIRAALT